MIRFLRPAGGDRRKLTVWAGACAVSFLIVLGVFASNGWLPRTDAFSGKKYGWFGRELPKNHAGSAWNPLPPPSPTPQLSKEYIYAGSRLLAVEDANATAAPPADIAVWRPSDGTWYVMGQAGSQAVTQQHGTAGDVPLPGDYDGDGKTDFAVWRPSTGDWLLTYSGGASPATINWGVSTDIPAPADFDGDGKTDLAVFRPGSTATWYIVPSGGSGTITPTLGTTGDKPAPADYDGDGRADIGVFRPSNTTFYWTNSSDGAAATAAIGYTGTHVVSSDYDGDGKADPAVYDALVARWYIRQSTTNTMTSTIWGGNGDNGCKRIRCEVTVQVHNDYDLDGKTDLAVWYYLSTGAFWTIRRSSDGSTRWETFGTGGDIPVPAFYRR